MLLYAGACGSAHLKDPIPADEAKVLIPRVDDPLSRGRRTALSGTERRTRPVTAVEPGAVETTEDRLDWGRTESAVLPAIFRQGSGMVGDTGVCQGDSGGPADQFERVIG